MKSTSISPIRLDAGHNKNWRVGAKPVAILNEASTQHERVAFCWGVANGLLDLCSFLNEHQSSDVARVSGLFFDQLTPLVGMLERVGSDTFEAEKSVGGVS